MSILGDTIVKNNGSINGLYCTTIVGDEITFSGTNYTAYAFDSSLTTGDIYYPIYCTTNKTFAKYPSPIVCTAKISNGSTPPNTNISWVSDWSAQYAGGSVIYFGAQGYTGWEFMSVGNGNFYFHDRIYKFDNKTSKQYSLIWNAYVNSDEVNVVNAMIWGGQDSTNQMGYYDPSTQTLHSVNTAFPQAYFNIGFEFHLTDYAGNIYVKKLVINDPNNHIPDGYEYTILNTSNVMLYVGNQNMHQYASNENDILGCRIVYTGSAVSLVRCNKRWYVNSGYFERYQ